VHIVQAHDLNEVLESSNLYSLMVALGSLTHNLHDEMTFILDMEERKG
jgi:hypothetical protein